MKIALVTGASSGLGREFARKLAGFKGIDKIWAVARREDRLEELSALLPGKVRKFVIDLTNKEERKTLEEALQKEQPKVKWLINGAGFGKIGKVENLSLEDAEDMVELNVKALCAVTRMVLPYLSENSRIIQIASSAAFLPQPQFAVYAASKAFVLSYSRALNEELSPRTWVTALCPGPVKTEFFQVAETTGKIPLYKRLAMAKPENVVQKGMKDCIKKRPVSVYGWSMKSFGLLCKVLPHSLVLRLFSAVSGAFSEEKAKSPDKGRTET